MRLLAPLRALLPCVTLLALVAASPSLAPAQGLTDAAAGEAASAVKVLPEDLPGYEEAEYESGGGALPEPLAVCAGRPSQPRTPFARTTSAYASEDMARVVATSVSVMPSAAVARDDVMALGRARFRRCFVGSVRKALREDGAKDGVRARVTIRPLWVRGPHAVGVRMRVGLWIGRVHVIQTSDFRWLARGPMTVLLVSSSYSAPMPAAAAHAIMDRLRERADAALSAA